MCCVMDKLSDHEYNCPPYNHAIWFDIDFYACANMVKK